MLKKLKNSNSLPTHNRPDIYWSLTWFPSSALSFEPCLDLVWIEPQILSHLVERDRAGAPVPRALINPAFWYIEMLGQFINVPKLLAISISVEGAFSVLLVHALGSHGSALWFFRGQLFCLFLANCVSALRPRKTAS